MTSTPENRSRTDQDRDLLDAARRGNREAFAVLYDRHVDHVHRFVHQFTKSVSEADDAVQEAFMAAVKSPFPVRDAEVRTYLCEIAKNAATAQFKKRRRYQPLETASPMAAGNHPTAQVLSKEQNLAVRNAVEKLPLLQKEAVMLFEFEERSLAEIAQITQSNIGTIKARLSRARESLRQWLTAFHPGGGDA